MEKIITKEMIDALRESLKSEMSPKRYRHTVEVEKMALRLGELYLPEKREELAAAALLHDITKEYPTDRHIVVCARYALEVPPEELYAPKIFHAKTAAAIIPDKYGEFATEDVISAVRFHTTGHGKMKLIEKLIYLADYIDMSRDFEDCLVLREAFFSAEPEKMDMQARLLHLDKILVMSFDMTISHLLEEGTPISVDTISARNALVCNIIKATK